MLFIARFSNAELLIAIIAQYRCLSLRWRSYSFPEEKPCLYKAPFTSLLCFL